MMDNLNKHIHVEVYDNVINPLIKEVKKGRAYRIWTKAIDNLYQNNQILEIRDIRDVVRNNSQEKQL